MKFQNIWHNKNFRNAYALALAALIFQLLVSNTNMLFAEDFSIPKNAYRIGNSWYCSEGYRRVGNECVKLNLPENAYVLGNAWYCKEGYRRVGDKCVKLKPGEKIRVVAPSYGYRSYSYSVSGYGDTGYVYGDIDADGSRDVSGYLYLEDGSEVYFDGEWAGKGEIEGYDEEGNYYELEVD